MDPLEMILDALSGYFTPPFLALTLVIGYLMFFLFFYETEYWNSVDWAERFFFGFLIGLFSMMTCTFVSLPLAFLLHSLYLEPYFTTAFYLIPVFFLMSLSLIRIDLRVPLSSKRANNYLLAYLANHKSYWPYLLFVASVVTYQWLGWNNPLFDGASRLLWGYFVIVLNFTVFMTFCVLTWFVVQLSCIPAKLSSVKIVALPIEVLRFCFWSFHRKKKNQLTKKENVYWV